MELSQGAIVAGRYKLDRLLGKGGMGEVWAATQTVTRMPVALKFLRDPSASADVRRRFLREARAACAVRHPSVVRIHDVLELAGGEPVMVMELLVGESLEQRLRREGRMPLGDVASILLRVVSAVGTAHELGIVHRDLKPDNIFLAEASGGLEIKVVDFGIAKLTAIEGDAAETGGLTSTGAMLGTPFYMSPEQAFGERKIDHRADIWSLGIILYRCLTGVLPTHADNIGQILKIIMTNAIPRIAEAMPELPADVASLVTRMLTQDRDKRPADLREVKAVLERYAGVSVEAFGAPAAEPADVATSTSKPTSAAPLPETAASRTAAPRTVGGVSVVGAEPSGAGRTWLAIGVGAIAVVLGIAAVFVRPSRPKEAIVAPSAPPRPEAPSVVASASATAGPAPTAPAPAASATASASVTVPVAAPVVSSTKRPVRSAATAAATSTGKPSMGGVIEKPPF
jgi:eukaryotic-like serine/threonine-protein kinase